MKKYFIIFQFLLFSTTLLSQNEKNHYLPPVDIAILKDGEFEEFNTDRFTNTGKPIILVFWATWCRPCVDFLDAFSDYKEGLLLSSDIKVFAVSVDDRISKQEVKDYARSKAWEFDILLDQNGEFKRSINLNMIPYTILLDQNGKAYKGYTGSSDGIISEIYDDLTMLDGYVYKDIDEVYYKSSGQIVTKTFSIGPETYEFDKDLTKKFDVGNKYSWVTDMQEIGNHLVVVGDFESFQGEEVEYIAALNKTTYKIDLNKSRKLKVDDAVEWIVDIRDYDDVMEYLFLGDFEVFNGWEGNGIGAIDKSLNFLLDETQELEREGIFFKGMYYVDDSLIMVAKIFHKKCGRYHDYVVMPTGEYIQTDYLVYDVHATENFIFLVGEFNKFGDKLIDYIAVLDKKTFKLLPDLTDTFDVDSDVYGIYETENHLFFLGDFDEFQGEEVEHIAALNKETYEIDMDLTNKFNTNSFVCGMYETKTHLYFYGGFDEFNGFSVNNVAAFRKK